MTRQEEMQGAAIEARCAVATSVSGDNYCSIDDLPYIEGKLSYDGLVEEAFIKGAEWADAYFAKKQIITMDAWVARDKCGDLSIWNKQPYRNLIDTCNYWERVDGDSITLPNNTFQTITWENLPRKVKVTIELEDEE